MRRLRSADWRTTLVVLAMAALAAAVILLHPPMARHLRDSGIDAVSQLASPPATADVVVIDIDAGAARFLGDWPWPRSRLARLVTEIAGGGPSAIALDMVLSGSCGPADPDNAALSAALAKAPATLGFVLIEQPAAVPVSSPVALRAPVELPDLWRSAGAESPCPEFAAAAAGLASVSLAGDRSAAVRTVPAVVAVQNELYPGLAVDAVRLAANLGTVIAGGTENPVLSLGELRVHIDSAGDFLLHASPPETWTARTLSASAAMTLEPGRLAGKIVILGSSLPQLGALRPTAADPLTPSIQIHADIATALLTGHLPWRPAAAPWVESAAMLAGALAALFLLLRARPVAAAVIILALACGLAALAAFAYHRLDLAIDPLLVMQPM